jgi:hypothetical protein
MLEGAVVGFLGVLREAAAGKLALPDVVLDALAADPLAGAGIVGAVAEGEVLFLFAVHPILRIPYAATGEV